jgi:hypothetical protein
VIDLKTFVSEHFSWCGVRIPRHNQIALGAQLEMSADENALVGCAVELDVEGYVVTGIMFPAESEEKREGFDLSMIACSDEMRRPGHAARGQGKHQASATLGGERPAQNPPRLI